MTDSVARYRINAAAPTPKTKAADSRKVTSRWSNRYRRLMSAPPSSSSMDRCIGSSVTISAALLRSLTQNGNTFRADSRVLNSRRSAFPSR
jgi:hypothetical protein